MRLPDFIPGNVARILAEWELFARGIWPGQAPDPAELRDDAEALLHAIVADMQSAQTAMDQANKSMGHGPDGAISKRVDKISRTHAAERVGSGFELAAVVAEYRALRASVIRLWRDSSPCPDVHDLDDLTRFNECVDQSLTEAIRSHVSLVESERAALLTREREARDEAEHADRAKDLFLATLSHEIRTPLNAIVGWVRILQESSRSEADIAEGLAVIDRSAKAQAQLINDILDVSRIVAGKLRLEVRPCDLAEIVKEGIAAVRAAAIARDITVDIQLDSSASRAQCDTARIQQVVWNLMSNAVKFTPKGGRISVTLARATSSYRIQVSDSGQGIAPDVLPYVFDRFRQADSSSQRQFGGLGLGLSIVKHIVEQHGGTVEARSEGAEKGATFIVHLPIRAVQVDGNGQESGALDGQASESDSSTSAGMAPLPQVRLDGLRVLIVDDEAEARRLLVRLLEQVGAIVTAAGSAAEAMKLLPEVGPEVLVSDLAMPREDGYDLIRRVRGSGPHGKDLPAVALTAFAHQQEQERALLAGFQVHLVKPVEPAELTGVIARLAGRTA